MRLDGKTGIVTGARRGIGRAIALALAREGATVVVSDISREDSQKVVDEIKRMGRKGLALKCDVSFSNDVEDMVRRTVAEFGRVDILVNNAGIIAYKPFLELTEEDWDRTLNVNAICPGAIDTDMAKGAKESGQLEQVLARIPKGRLGQPEDIANLAVFLASDESEYISGAAIVIDGGWLTT
jgi:NAD(P)-dependent dehydrogenase (short-subunit alcohol dehydrogenase family)